MGGEITELLKLTEFVGPRLNAKPLAQIGSNGIAKSYAAIEGSARHKNSRSVSSRYTKYTIFSECLIHNRCVFFV